MKAVRWAVVAGVLAGAAACSRTGFDGPATYRYLERVGQIRTQMNADNKDRIPASIHGTDFVALGNEATRIEQLKQSVNALPTEGVDPDAVQFARNFSNILDAYKSTCSDSAELFREVVHRDETNAGTPPLMPELRSGQKEGQIDTLGAVGAMLDAEAQLAVPAASGNSTFEPVALKVRDDLKKLEEAKGTHHEFTLKLKADFAQRYPDKDWASKDILP